MTPNYLANRVIPKEVVRDLLAICRVLYATRKAEGAGPDELSTLEQAGKAFGQAHCEGGTVGSRAAWSWSEKGLKLLGEALAGHEVTVTKLVANWAGKLKQFPDS